MTAQKEENKSARMDALNATLELRFKNGQVYYRIPIRWLVNVPIEEGDTVELYGEGKRICDAADF